MKLFLAGTVALALLATAGCNGSTEERVYFGYVEGDYVQVAPREGGTIASVAVADGQKVAAGEVLAELDSARHRQAVDAAKARVDAAEANLRDMKEGSRREEIDVIVARIRAAESNLELARENLKRTAQLITRKLVPQSQEDRDKAAVEAAEASVNQLKAELKVARLPKRPAQIDAAEDQVEAAKAELASRREDLADRILRAPSDGRVDRVIRRKGEFVSAGSGVVSLLPDGNVKVRFFVPEPELHDISVGDRIGIDCTSCSQRLPATVSFVSPEAEFTPPVIYSLEERARLVFLVEARFDTPAGLSPGQPVDVHPAP